MEENGLQFSPFSSCADMGFWWTLSKKKLEEMKLTESAIEISGYYNIGDPPRSCGRLNFDYTAFDDSIALIKTSRLVKGCLHVKNTIDAFKLSDKKKLLDEEGSKIWEKIKSGEALENPSDLNRFILLTYVDLKKYSFYYWFGFPAFSYQAKINCVGEMRLLKDYFSDVQLSEFFCAQEVFFKTNSSLIFFIIHVEDQTIKLHKLTEYQEIISKAGKILFGFCDPSTLEKYPGWPLRNYLTLLSYCLKIKDSIEVLCFRQRYKDGQCEIGHSIIINVDMASIQKSDGIYLILDDVTN